VPASTPHNRHRSAGLDAPKSYAGTPTIGNARSLWFSFHSPGAMEAGQCGVERRPPDQERSELQAHEATVLQCLAVEVRKSLGRSPTVPYVIRFFPGHPTQLRDGRRALCRGAAFDLWCRSCQGCDLLLRKEAYASAVNPRGPQLSYSSLEFNFALQRANDLTQLVARHSDFDGLIPSQLRIGKFSGGTRISMLLGAPA